MEKTRKRRKTITFTEVTHKVCDKCEEEIDIDLHEVFDFRLRTGCSFLEGGGGEEFTLDLCQDCAPEAVELLKEHGFNVIETEWDI